MSNSVTIDLGLLVVTIFTLSFCNFDSNDKDLYDVVYESLEQSSKCNK